jgi:hypothetical protein
LRKATRTAPRHCLVDNKRRLANNSCDFINWFQLDILMAGFRVSKKQGIY